MQKVANFSKYPKNGRIFEEYRLSDFNPETPADLALLQMAEGIISRKEFSEVEGWPPDGRYDEKNVKKIWARDLVKGDYPEKDSPVVRRLYNLESGIFATKIIYKKHDLRPEIKFAPDSIIAAHMLEAEGKEKIEAELKNIFC